jgi:hypothetical protein
MTKQCLRDIVDKKFDEMNKERSPNAEKITALLIPKPTIQLRARFPFCEWQF